MLAGRRRRSLPCGSSANQLAAYSRFGYLSRTMGIANIQNLVRTLPVLPRPYGIRVRLRAGDPFAKLLGADWQKTHWFFTAADSDRVLQGKSPQHENSPQGDPPPRVV